LFTRALQGDKPDLRHLRQRVRDLPQVRSAAMGGAAIGRARGNEEQAHG
jgi:hypothetical protein